MGGKQLGRKAPTAKVRGARRRAPTSKGPKVKETSPASLPTLSTLLREDGNLDWSIEEHQNMDWRGENEMVREVLHLVSRQPSFVPRVGELVLWCDEIDGEIRQDPSSGNFRVFHPATRTFAGYPQWVGGVVTQAPISEQPISFEDISREPDKEYAVTSSGFRIEWYPGPNARDKNLSKRYSHVPMHHVRPLAFWMEYMAGIPNEEWHPTIRNCLKAMSTLSMIKRYRLRGARPAAKLYAKGCFLGAEALYAGDIVRVSLDRERVVTEVFKIHAVVTRIENMATSAGDLSGENTQRMSVEFHGSIFTLDPRRSNTHIPIDPLDLHPVMRGYGPWFYVGLPSDIVTVDHSQILGRLFEKQAMELWSPRYRSTVLDMGCKGVLEAREYATKRDCRAKHAAGLYVADSRAESLNLGTFNGIDVGAPDPELDPNLWQRVLVALDGTEKDEEEQSPAEADPKFAMMTRALNQDSSEDSQEDVTEDEWEQGTDLAAIAAWNKKRDHPTQNGDEDSSDELQVSSPRKRYKFDRVEI